MGMIKFYGAGIEITNPLKNGLNTAVSVAIGIGNTDIEIKSTKPLSQIYFDITSAHDGALSLLYYDGAALSSVTTVNDATLALKQLGFVAWTNETNNSKDSGFYRYVFRVTGSTVAVVATVRFIGQIFSEDFDLKTEYPLVTEYLPSPDTSFTRFHVAAMSEIVSYFRGKGKIVFDTQPRDLTEYDFLEPEQLRQGSKYLALSKIFFMASDAVEDKYYEMFKDYKSLAYKSIDLFFLTLDEDGDGEISEVERVAIQPLVIIRA